MRRFNKDTDIMDERTFKDYEAAFKATCERCMGEESDCIVCPARVSYYTLRSENKAWEFDKEDKKDE